ncbi:hypothetical protein ACQUQU_07345 [Thalassolituus sp. LLYu03]|uniref:hypothetical protein n=1 Tax=Thalassolituus sp. LLYu03 TaxID=3421656 RepID=UPI003D2E11A5
MEGLMEYLPAWAGYLVFALIGYRCWRYLFFWLREDSDVRRFFHTLGAVLLFTPAPVAAGSSFFAPAFVVFPFTLLGSGLASAMYSVTWLLGGLCTGLVILGVRQFLAWMKEKTENDR